MNGEVGTPSMTLLHWGEVCWGLWPVSGIWVYTYLCHHSHPWTGVSWGHIGTFSQLACSSILYNYSPVLVFGDLLSSHCAQSQGFSSE